MPYNVNGFLYDMLMDHLLLRWDPLQNGINGGVVIKFFE